MKKFKFSVQEDLLPKILKKEEWVNDGAGNLTKIMDENDPKFHYHKMLLSSTGSAHSLVEYKEEKKREGFVGHYVHHNGRLGVLVKVYTDTDFAANTKELRAFAKNIALQVCSNGDANLMAQKFVKNEDLTIADLLKNIRYELKENVELGSTIRFEV